MQQRHLDRQQYFQELAATSRNFYISYLQPFVRLTAGTRVLEIGCGEGGNLLPFAETGCQATGIDISPQRIKEASQFFQLAGRQADFICHDFMQVEAPSDEDLRYDLILVHDVIEHIEPPCKPSFMAHIKPFLKAGGIVFFGFPAWQNPFGGHQQISYGLASKLPFIHLLPAPLYEALLRRSGADQQKIAELRGIRRSRMTIEHFERLAQASNYDIVKRTLWLINPHYQQKFHLKPRRLWPIFASIPIVRNYYTTSAFYLLRNAATM